MYALLRHKMPELEVVTFNLNPNTTCGIKGCAWGASWRQFAKLSSYVDIDAEKYVIGRYDHILINQIKIKANVVIIDKPLLIKDLLDGASPLDPSEADFTEYERIVDATGVSRAYLSSQQKPSLVNSIQLRTTSTSITCPMVFVNRTGGYAWLFPLGKDEAHIGSLSPEGINAATRELDRIRNTLVAGSVRCSCSATICYSGPVYPFIKGKIWGLGEAIGLVDPIACAGIVPAMNSAKLMGENWDNGYRYEKKIWQYYSYMLDEVKTVSKIRRGEKLLYRDVLLPHRAFDTLGIYPSFPQKIKVVSMIRKIQGIYEDQTIGVKQ